MKKGLKKILLAMFFSLFLTSSLSASVDKEEQQAKIFVIGMKYYKDDIYKKTKIDAYKLEKILEIVEPKDTEKYLKNNWALMLKVLRKKGYNKEAELLEKELKVPKKKKYIEAYLKYISKEMSTMILF